MIIGIDLGTTNSLVAVWRGGRAELIPNALGDYLTPSAVSLSDDDELLIGRAARDRLITNPDRSVDAFKRYMGSDRVIQLGRREFRPEELSSLVLRALKEDAEHFLGEPVEEAVISVPAYFKGAKGVKSFLVHGAREKGTEGKNNPSVPFFGQRLGHSGLVLFLVGVFVRNFDEMGFDQVRPRHRIFPDGY